MKILAVLLMFLGLSSLAQANVFSLGSGLTNLELVDVSDLGNSADVTGHGAVNYAYRIGKYEVTVAQYVDFLNAKASQDLYGLWDSKMADTTTWGARGCNIQRSVFSGRYVYTIGTGSASDLANWGNRPVNYVSRWDACRFVNWLGNGQGSGDTETGAYEMNGYMGTNYYAVQRNAQWTWALASEDEWYKAAYYKGGINAGYWAYPTQSDSVPRWEHINPDPGNSANYYGSDDQIVAPYWRTNVGEFENSPSAYGTYDQGGNVWEWTDTGVYYGGASSRGSGWMLSSMRYSYTPCYGYESGGFRVVTVIPEPSQIITIMSGMAGFIGFRRRRN